jgi:hypothetical protein
MMKFLSLLLALAVGVGAYKLGDWLTPYDDSDAPPNRSGFAIKRDALTGCEYLKTYGLFGAGVAVTPRVDAEGKHVCRKK